MNPDASHCHPPRARAAFRVGVVGHRPNRLKQADLPALQSLLRNVLELVQSSVVKFCGCNESLFTRESPILRAVSPLAEGTDRILAEQAMTLGYELLCPMPFAQEEFEKDFAPGLEPDSVNRFRALLARAEQGAGLTKFEMAGNRAAEGEAYGAAGRVVLNQSDLLVVVWDGEPAAGAGGTVQTLREALAYHVPVLWIDAQAPHPWQMLDDAADLACLLERERCQPQKPSANLAAILDAAVTGVLRPPLPRREGGGGSQARRPDLRDSFFSERKPRFNRAVLWKLFRDAVGSNKFSWPQCRVKDFETAVAPDWPDDAPGFGGWVNQRLRPHYAWADKLADLYADSYRSAFLSYFLLGAAAVFFALLPWAFSWKGEAAVLGCLLAEAGAIALIITLVLVGKRRHWHERWMDYRLVAELVRQVRFLFPLGGGKPFPRLAQHLHGYSPFNDWTYWHVRAIERAIGLPAAKLTPDYLRDSLRYTQTVVESQVAFHATNFHRCEKLDHRLHLAGVGLFLLTAAGIAGHFVCLYFHHDMAPSLHDGMSSWLTFACAFFPALGAALAAINNQGEFTRIAKRSLAMREHLAQIDQEARALIESRTPPTFPQATALALRAAQLMVDEVLDWRVVFLDRPSELPA